MRTGVYCVGMSHDTLLLSKVQTNSSGQRSQTGTSFEERDVAAGGTMNWVQLPVAAMNKLQGPGAR